MSAQTQSVRKVETSEHDLTDDEVEWTQAYFVEQLSHGLETYEVILDNNGLTTVTHPYKQQVEDLMYRIPAFKNPPPFVIHYSWFSEEMKQKYNQFKKFSYKHEFEQALLDAVGHLFANKNSEYYYGSVKQLLWASISINPII